MADDNNDYGSDQQDDQSKNDSEWDEDIFKPRNTIDTYNIHNKNNDISDIGDIFIGNDDD